MNDSRIVVSKWMSLVAMVLLWASVVISVVFGAGVPWVALVLAVLCTALAAYVWFGMPSS